jgi:hypothetical protein
MTAAMDRPGVFQRNPPTLVLVGCASAYVISCFGFLGCILLSELGQVSETTLTVWFVAALVSAAASLITTAPVWRSLRANGDESADIP